jgi:DNA-binding NtrC family response regulator
VKGAFTGADRDKLGKFEAAKGGTLLLDEIDVLGPNQQAKLLRVIETGEFEQVGSNETRTSRARLIAASNVDLKELMEQEEFRADLYYRLSVLEFRIPPLRQRPLDIVPLTLDFVAEFAASHGVTIRRVHPEFLAALKQYDWPGNIRELKNHVRRAVLFCRNEELSADDLAPSVLRAAERSTAATCLFPSTLSEKVALSEREILEQALREHGNKRTATAQSLGISRVGLYKKMKKYGMISSNGNANGNSGINGNANGHGSRRA